MNSLKRFPWRCSLGGNLPTPALEGRRWVAIFFVLMVFAGFFGILPGGPTPAFGAIEEIKPILQVHTDNYGIRLRFPSVLFFDSVFGETYLVTGGKAQLTVFADDFFPLATAGPGRGLYTPQCGAIDRNGQVYIGQSARDGRPARITILNGAWIITREISFDEIPEATNFVPRRLAISRDGLIYVASQHRGVMVLDNEGIFLRWLQPMDQISKRAAAAAKEAQGEKESPVEPVTDAATGDAPAANITEESDLAGSGGPPDFEDAEGRHPVQIRGVTIDNSGNIYLISSETGKIYVYGPDEAFRFTFGTKGGTPGRLSQPRGVAIDQERGLMYVVDYMRHTILTYDKEGTWLFEFGGRGDAPGWYNFPTDIAVNNHGQVMVSDLFNDRIQVLEIRYQKEFPTLEELKEPLPPSQGTNNAAPAGPAAASDGEGAKPPAPQLDVEVIEEVIPEQLPASPDTMAQ